MLQSSDALPELEKKMQKKYQVFVSSTYSDLKDERRAIIQTIMEMDCIPSGMEAFPAADEEQMSFIKRVIDDCDYYIIVIGGRYGSIDEVGVSYTEKEYDYAVSLGMTVLAFVHANPEAIDPSKTDLNADIKRKLDRFRDKVKTGRLVKLWQNTSDLPGQVALSLSRAIRVNPAVGWIRGDAAASDDLLNEINSLRKEKDDLTSKLLAASSAKLQIPDLADIQTPITVSGTHRIKRYSSYDDVAWSVSTSCAEVFSLISPGLIDCPSDGSMNREIAKVLCAKNDLIDDYAKLDEQDYFTLRVQLEAHGLVRVVRSSTVGGGVGVFWNLTEKGRSAMFELRALRTTKTAVDGVARGLPELK